MRKKLCAIMMSLLLAAISLAGCSVKNEEASVEPGAAKEGEAAVDGTNSSDDDSYKVLCLLNGSLGDKGFYDNVASGMYRLRDEKGCEIKIIEMGRDETTYEDYFIDESEKDWDLIVTGTFSVKDLVQEIAVQYPDQKYLCYDISIDFDTVDTKNVMGVTYQSNEAGFMGGALAALMFNSGDPKVDTSNPTLGFVGSMDSANINDFLVGYIEGIKVNAPKQVP